MLTVVALSHAFAAKRRIAMSRVPDGLLSISYTAWDNALLKIFGMFTSMQNVMMQCVLQYSYHGHIHGQSRELRVFSLASADLDIAQVRNPMPKGQGLASLPNGVL